MPAALEPHFTQKGVEVGQRRIRLDLDIEPVRSAVSVLDAELPELEFGGAALHAVVHARAAFKMSGLPVLLLPRNRRAHRCLERSFWSWPVIEQ